MATMIDAQMYRIGGLRFNFGVFADYVEYSMDLSIPKRIAMEG